MSTAELPTLQVSPRTESGQQGYVKRLVRRPLAVVCLVYLLVLVVIGVVAPVALPDVATQYAGDLLEVRQGPSWDHPLGTDTLGRDVLDRLLVGTRITLIGVVQAMAVVMLLGIPLGLLAGYLGGRVDRFVGWSADLTFAMPAIVIIIVVASVFPNSMTASMITLGILAAPGLMRVVRSAALPVRQEQYVSAAQVSGLSHSRIMRKHITPRIAGAVIVQCSLIAAAVLLVQSGLAFLNLIVAPPQPSWGGMVAEGLTVIEQQPWLILPPGTVIAFTVLALCLLGDVLRDTSTESWTLGTSRVHTRRPLTAAASHVARQPETSDALLRISNLDVSFADAERTTPVLSDVGFAVYNGRTTGLVGESGCGKTMTAMAILRLLPGTAGVQDGRVLFKEIDLLSLSEKEMRRIRGGEIGLVSQEPMAALNPSFRVEWQLAEAVRQHRGVSRRGAVDVVHDLLRRVHLPNPHAVARKYPHELSGGMAQRVCLARALAGEPSLLIADEPTTALDVTVQAEIMDLLREIQQDSQMAILLVTHNWGLVADICDDVVVMYAGQVVEAAKVTDIFSRPLHPYTEALLASDPHRFETAETLPTIPGSVPRLGDWPEGCRFRPRCSYASAECQMDIELRPLDEGRQVRCVHHDRVGSVSIGRRAEA